MLSSLLHYYEENINELPPFGCEYREISFVVILSKKGEFLDIQDRRIRGEGEKMLVPQAVKRSGIGASPNFLWDNLKYVFGIGEFVNGKQKEALNQKRSSFVEHLKEMSKELNDHEEIIAVIKFLEGNFLKDLKSHPLWKDLSESAGYVSFSIENTDRLVCQDPSILKACFSLAKDSSEKKIQCLVTGKEGRAARLHPLVQGVAGAQGSGASLISFNLDSVESFGKEQGYNAPMSQEASFQCAASLNYILEFSQKVAFSEAMTVVFWAQNKSPFESVFADFLKMTSKETLSSFLLKCADAPGDSSPFFVHALSANGSRLSSRFSWQGSIKDLKALIKMHFQHLEIESFNSSSEAFSVYSLLQSISPCRDLKYLQPRFAGEFLFSILNNDPYPQALLPTLLKRISDEEGISHRRASLMKASINKAHPSHSLKTSLDSSKEHTGYALGRLFAVLETAQKQGKRKKAATFYSYYKMSSVSPAKIFPYLLKRFSFQSNLSSSHAKYLNVLKDSILKFVPFYPSQLSSLDQGALAVGYYQQKQEIFYQTKKRKIDAAE